MIRLDLNLPEATVNYNATGALVGCPVEHTPNQIRNYSIPFEITGYVSKNDFLAYSLYSPERKFTISEQLSLLTSLGFKTVPYFENEEGQGNQLITVKNQYSMYKAKWISLPSGKEFKVPELAHVNQAKWIMGFGKTLTLDVITDKGEFEIIDMKLLAYFQPGCTAKVWNGTLQPMNTAPVTVPIPEYCPKCNNPLKRVQIYPDLPLFYKCTNSICDQMVLDEEPEVDVVPEVKEEVADTFLEETEKQEILEESVSDEVVDDTADNEPVEAEDDSESESESETDEVKVYKCYVDTAKVESEDVDKLVSEGKIEVVDDVQDADCILVKTKLSVSKAARNLGKEFEIELKPLSDFE